MRKLILIFALIPLISFAQYGQRGAGGGSTFYWSLTGQAQKTDSLRIIQGSNMTITQSGNTVTFNGAAGAGSIANVRANTGWTSDGTTAQDTLALAYLLNKANIRFIVTDADGDTLWFYPQNLLPFVLKDGTTILAAIDSTGRAGFGTSTSGQARRAIFNVLGRAANDTLAIFSNDGGGVVGDSSWVLLPSGAWKADLSGVAPTYFQLGDGCSIQLVDSDRYPRIVSGGGGGILSLYDGGSDEYIFSSITFTIGSGNSITFTSGGTITSTSNGNVRLIPNGSGQTLVGTTVAQAFMTIRASGTSDTTLIVRNDKNATLDSTFMVFPTGRISRTDAKALPAAGWAGTAANAPALDTVAYIIGYQFDKAIAETLTVDFELPAVFSTISSINVEVINPNTAGDSVAFSVAWLGRADGEDMTVAFSSALSDTIDLGTIKDARKILTIAGSFTNLAANDRLILKLWRDPSISNDVDSDVFLTEVKVNGVGLLR